MNIPTVALVIIGNEVLSGRVADQNTPYLARRLYELGADLRKVEVVPDEVEEIARAVRTLSETHDLVLTAGGVGPTHDDVTVAGVARAFGQEVVRHSWLENLLSHHYQGEALTAAQARMAEIPDGAELLVREGEDFPQVVVRNVYLLPGVPAVLQRRFEALADRFRGRPFTRATLRLEAEETVVAPVLNRTLRLHQEVRLGSYPEFDESVRAWSVLLVLESRDPGAVDRARAFLLESLPSVLPSGTRIMEDLGS